MFRAHASIITNMSDKQVYMYVCLDFNEYAFTFFRCLGILNVSPQAIVTNMLILISSALQ